MITLFLFIFVISIVKTLDRFYFKHFQRREKEERKKIEREKLINIYICAFKYCYSSKLHPSSRCSKPIFEFIFRYIFTYKSTLKKKTLSIEEAEEKRRENIFNNKKCFPIAKIKKQKSLIGIKLFIKYNWWLRRNIIYYTYLI